MVFFLIFCCLFLCLCEVNADSVLDLIRTDPELSKLASLIAGTGGGIVNPDFEERFRESADRSYTLFAPTNEVSSRFFHYSIIKKKSSKKNIVGAWEIVTACSGPVNTSFKLPAAFVDTSISFYAWTLLQLSYHNGRKPSSRLGGGLSYQLHGFKSR
jgi:hypothetical protein